MENHDDGRILAPLRLVDRRRIGEHQLVQVAAVVLHRTPVEVDDHRPVVGVDRLHEPDVAVIDVLVVVVPELHHPVANPEHRPAADDGVAVRIERLLQLDIEVVRPQDVLPHRYQNLHVLQGIHAELPRNTRGHELDRPLHAHPGVFAAHEVEVGVALTDFQRLARVHVMGVRDDETRRILAEDEVELRRGNDAGLDEVPQDAPRADGRKLVRIAYPHDRRRIRQRRKKVARELHVDHRRLVEDEDIALQLVLRIVRELVVDRIPLQEPVNRLRWNAHRFGHPLRRASRRRREHDLELGTGNLKLLLIDLDQGADDRRLADAGSARDDRELRLKRVLQRQVLLRRQLEARARLPPGDRIRNRGESAR